MRWYHALFPLFYLELAVGIAWRIQLPPYHEPVFHPEVIYDLPYQPAPAVNKDCWAGSTDQCWLYYEEDI